MITIVDYGLGNIQAFARIYKNLGIEFAIAKDPDTLARATRLILPGVGSFDWAMNQLNTSGICNVLSDLVMNQHVPVLGICVGMQMMADSSEEGSLPGLGWIPGEVKKFDETLLSSNTGLPHMGWNDVHAKPHPLFQDILDPLFYFLHSYYFAPHKSEFSIAQANYGLDFSAAVCNSNAIGVQFHPEKSHHWGIHLLKNFAQSQFN